MKSIALICLLGIAAAAASGPVVHTASGDVQGADGDGYHVFKGIPYAATTGGANRWLPPQPRAPWTSPLNATAYGPGCYQTHHNADVPKNLSEDCLYLNVWVPSNASSTTKLPVMIFFHGGSFAEGSSDGPFDLYDGAFIAGNYPVIVVTANYRLGALGFLAVNDDIRGNFGIQDQRFALKWLQTNIGFFGGDPKRVTLWGESAGAMSAGLHLVSPASNGLYNQVLMESNPSGFRYRSLDDMKLYGDKFCELLNCTQSSGSGCNETCIRAQSTQSVGKAWNDAGNAIIPIVIGNWDHWLDAFLDWVPTVDGEDIPINPYEAWQTGKYNTNATIMLGTNQNEGATFIYAAFKSALPMIAFEALLDGIFGGEATKKIKSYYASSWPGTWDDGRTMFSQILTDYWFRCASEQWATATTKAGTPAYMYHFRHKLYDGSFLVSFGLPKICATDTCHASELPFVFHASTNPVVTGQNFTFSSDEVVMEKRFSDYWAHFAMTGNPNNPAQPKWPVWDPNNRTTLLMQTPVPSTDNSKQLCEFWDTIGYDH